MLIGEYTHTLDSKKRTSLPSKFRKEIGRKVVITPGLDGCLFMYPASNWQKIAEKLAGLGTAQADRRSFNRFMLAGAVEVEVDSVGRVLIPDHLRDFAHLEDKIIFTGVYNRVEIWNSSEWSKYKKKVESQADDLAEKLGEVGGF
jgi:MraZ protein